MAKKQVSTPRYCVSVMGAYYNQEELETIRHHFNAEKTQPFYMGGWINCWLRINPEDSEGERIPLICSNGMRFPISTKGCRCYPREGTPIWWDTVKVVWEDKWIEMNAEEVDRMLDHCGGLEEPIFPRPYKIYNAGLDEAWNRYFEEKETEVLY